jgi:RNA polymerase sigma-70 factor (ECF subfamily)
VAAFVSAWERADVAAMVSLLAADVRFSMPPLPAWFCGRDDVLRFMTVRMWPDGPWRLVRVAAGGQLAFACYQRGRLGAVCVVTLRDGLVAELTGFLDPRVHRRLRRAAGHVAVARPGTARPQRGRLVRVPSP